MTGDAIAEPHPRRFRGSLRAGSRALACILIWWVHGFVPYWVGEIHLDASWGEGLGYAWSHGWQAGVDYVFTFGPLGYFATNVYVPDLYWTKLVVWEGAFKLLLAGVLTSVAFRIPGTWSRVLCLLLLFLPIDPDAYAFLCIVGIAIWVLGREPVRAPVALAGGCLLALFPLIKFSYAAPVLACAAVIAIGAGPAWRVGGALVVAFLGTTIAAWWFAGQSLLNFPVYLRRSMQLADGFSEGMSTPDPPGTKLIALAIAGLLVFLAVRSAAGRPRSFPRLAWAFAGVAILFVVYKAAFVRAADHTPIYFGYTLIAPLLAAAMGAGNGARKAAESAARFACPALSLLGLAVASGRGVSEPLALLAEGRIAVARSARAFLQPTAYRAGCEEALARQRERYSFPRLRATVGSSTIDLISTSQGLLFLNDLNWRPRPVFQSYAALTPELMELNAGFYRSDRASEFLLLGLEPIDGRLAASEDALALQVIAREYEPVQFVQGWLLMRRAPRGEPRKQPQVVLEREIAFGETLDLGGLDGSCHLLRLDVRYSPWGRLRSFLDQAPPFHVEIDTDAGRTLQARIVPAMMRAGVILDPLIHTQADWKDWCVGAKLPRPRALRFPLPDSPALYADRVRVTVLRDDDTAPLPRPDRDAELEVSRFDTPPAAARAARRLRRTFVGPKEAVLLAPPSEMRYDVPAGEHALRIGFGFVRQAWESDGTDGAVFRVVVRSAGETDRVLFERFLDPVRVSNDRGPQSAELRFRVEAPASVILAIDPGPRGNAQGDWTAWTEVSLES